MTTLSKIEANAKLFGNPADLDDTQRAVLDLVTAEATSVVKVPARSDMRTEKANTAKGAVAASRTKKANRTASLPGAYSNQPGRKSLLLGAPDLKKISSSLLLKEESTAGPEVHAPVRAVALPEAIPITAEVVEAEESRERKSSIKTTIFHSEVHGQRDYYEAKLAALAAENKALKAELTASKDSQLAQQAELEEVWDSEAALAAENEALQAKLQEALDRQATLAAENDALRASKAIQATISQQEQQEQRDYYEDRMEEAAHKNQQLQRTLRKMEQDQEEREAVIHARGIDQARQELYALKARLEHQTALVEQAHQVELQQAHEQVTTKDQELCQARKEIVELRWQLGSPNPQPEDSARVEQGRQGDQARQDLYALRPQMELQMTLLEHSHKARVLGRREAQAA